MPQIKGSLRPILMADDDMDDCLMTRRAFEKNNVPNPFVTVADGVELMDYVHRRGSFASSDNSPRPVLILLDLNMPKMDGRKALAELKSDERLKKIPIVVFSTSQAEEDILRSYESGANSYITKAYSFEELVKVIDSLKHYWLDTVELPPENGHS